MADSKNIFSLYAFGGPVHTRPNLALHTYEELLERLKKISVGETLEVSLEKIDTMSVTYAKAVFARLMLDAAAGRLEGRTVTLLNDGSSSVGSAILKATSIDEIPEITLPPVPPPAPKAPKLYPKTKGISINRDLLSE